MSSFNRAPFDGKPAPIQGDGWESSPTSSTGASSINNSSTGKDAPARMTADGVARLQHSGICNVDTQTGDLSYTIPIHTSPGRGGFEPTLSLQYSSGQAGSNGAFGMGWAMNGVDHITRKTAMALPTYDDSVDIFVHSTFGDLIPSRQAERIVDGYQVSRYRPRIESDPIRVERWAKQGEIFWKTISSNNVVTIIGLGAEHQISHRTDTDAPARVFSWLTTETYDSHGNHIKYSYKAEDDNGVERGRDSFESHRTCCLPQRYIKSISYGNTVPCRDLANWDVTVTMNKWLFEVVFDYGEHNIERPTTLEEQAWDIRSDPFSVYKCGFELRTYRRCRRVLMFHHFESELGRADCLVSSTSFNYQIEAHSRTTVLQSYTQKGHKPKGDHEYCMMALPCIEFTYTTVPNLADLPIEEMYPRASDLANASSRWIDLDGEGAPGLLTKAREGGWYYQRNLTHDGQPQLGDARLIPTLPNVANSNEWSYEDIKANGLPSVVVSDEQGTTRGFYEHEGEGGWLNFIPFESYPIVHDLGSAHRVDLTGNGHEDILQMTPNGTGEFTWYTSLGPRGFGMPRSTVGAPSLPRDDADTAIQFHDMTGDGLVDIVQIRNGSVSYWPNMGYGVFGTRVIMGNAPCVTHDGLFSPQCVFLADITGSGTADLIYVQPQGGAAVYYNRSGNSWSEEHSIPSFPPLDRVSAVEILDIGGWGTPSLCWMSDLDRHSGSDGLATVRFVKLMQGQPSGLLKGWTNSIGSETAISYRSSFSFYREHQLQGTPWATRVPFLIQCVSRTETVDHISKSFHVTRYSYHNGHYDYVERQFRGFQMVDVWDAEEFSSSAPSQFQQVPILTRKWFYLGLERLDKESYLPQCFQASTPRYAPICSAKIPSSLDAAATAEAYRALVGYERRSEVFSAEISSVKVDLPYLVTQKTYEVVLSETASSRYSCRVNEREELTVRHEQIQGEQEDEAKLSCDEGRVEQRLVLDTDEYGNILLEATIQYGKSSSHLGDPKYKELQRNDVITFSQLEYTNSIESEKYFQIPLVWETKKYRVFPKTSSLGTDRYSWQTMADDDFKFVRGAKEIPIHADIHAELRKPNPDGYRVLISQYQTLYSRGDLRGPLPRKALEEYSIVYRGYQLAFTSDYLRKALIGPASLMDEKTLFEEVKRGAYLELPENSGDWWAPSTRPLFGDDSQDVRLEAARAQFYVPNGEIDPFEAISKTHFDVYYISVLSTTNSVGSTTMYENDYATLQPVLITDSNMNQTQKAYDPLGRAIGEAVKGKLNKPTGDDLEGFMSDINQETLERFFKDPAGDMAKYILSTATRRTIYNFDSFGAGKSKDGSESMPVWVAELARHEHVASETSSPTHISVRITYFNGRGGAIQTALLSGGPDQHGIVTWDFRGRVIEDKKGLPVQVFQPFCAPSHTFKWDPKEDYMVSTTVLRDPLDRIAGVLNADHTWSKTRFTPWSQVYFSAGSTMKVENPVADEDLGQNFKRLDPSLYSPTWYGKRMDDGSTAKEKQAAIQSEVYSKTSTTTHLDTLGRPILEEAGVGNKIRTSGIQYDVWGNSGSTEDAFGRVVNQAIFDLLGRPLNTRNMDSGQRWMLPDCTGTILSKWSERRTRQRIECDPIGRVTGIWLHSDTLPSGIRIVENVYGEAAANAAEQNLNGQLYLCYDQSGLHKNSEFDAQANCTATTVQYASRFQSLVDWSVNDKDGQLEPRSFHTRQTYNALNQIQESVSPDLGSVRRKYDVAERLNALISYDSSGSIQSSSIIDIKYRPDNQIVQIIYGNNSKTIQMYDSKTRQLLRTDTLRTSDNAVLQNVLHTYDVIGKVIYVEPNVGVLSSQQDLASPTRQFWYDCFGQLVRATGREQVEAGPKYLRPHSSTTNTSDASQTIRYEETYTYDIAGNTKTMQHVPEGEYFGWTRTYTYEESSCIESNKKSNRLTRTAINNVTEEYGYDDDAGRNGCVTLIPGYSNLTWDFEDRLQSFLTQSVSEGSTPERTWYIDDAQGTRVRKVTERSASNTSSVSPTIRKETMYLPLGDIVIRYQGGGKTASNTSNSLHVGGNVLGQGPVVVVETGTDILQPLARYRISEQMDLDAEAKVVSYQEYSPFGVATYTEAHLDAPRAYRFANYRWDCESGLYFCGARYYASWIGRWISPAP